MYDLPTRTTSVMNSSLPISFSRSHNVIDLLHACSSNGMTFSRGFDDVPIVIAAESNVYPMYTNDVVGPSCLFGSIGTPNSLNTSLALTNIDALLRGSNTNRKSSTHRAVGGTLNLCCNIHCIACA